MAISFNTTTNALEDEIINLILEGHIQARIDSQNKVLFNFFQKKSFNFIYFQILYAKDVDQRTVTFERSLEMGKEHQKRTKAVVLRSLIMKYNISVKVKLKI